MTAMGLAGYGETDYGVLSQLTGLEELTVCSDNSDISELSTMTNLKKLTLDVYQIKDITPLSKLTELTDLAINYHFAAYDSEFWRVGIASWAMDEEIAEQVRQGIRENHAQVLTIKDLSALKSLTKLESLSLSMYNSGFVDTDRVAVLDDLSDLDELSKLKYLSLSSTTINDVTSVSRLTGLTSLTLSDCEIENISFISGMTKLEYLDLSMNEIDNISPVAGLIKLKHLDIGNNGVSDISPAGGLIELEYLDISNNNIDLGYMDALDNLMKLYTLKTDGNYNSKLFELYIDGYYEDDIYFDPQVVQLSTDDTVLKCAASDMTEEDWANVLKMENLAELTIRNATAADFAKLSNFKKLEKLTVYFKTGAGEVGGDVLTEEVELSVVSDLSLLTGLSLNKAMVRGVSTLSEFKNLTALSLYNCAIEEVDPIGKLSNLTSLNMSQQSIFSGIDKLDDISFLADLNKLEYLNLNGNSIRDLSPLENMTELKELYLSDNIYIANITPLSRLTKLEKLDLYQNGITDISVLSNMAELKELNLGLNILTDISPLSKLTGLTVLNLAANEISNISPLYNLDKLQELNIGGAFFMQSSFRPNPVSQSDVEAFQQAHPDCEVRAYTGDVEFLQNYESYADFIAPYYARYEN